MKTDALRHPKLRRLKRILKIKQFEAIGILEGLFQFACLYANDGRVGKWPAEDLADFLEWQQDPEELVEALRSAGWIDGQGDQATIHDWGDHCPRYITQRQARRKENATEDQQAPLSADEDQQHLPNRTQPNKPNHKKTFNKAQVDQLIDRLKTTKGLDPIRKSKGRVALIRQAIALIGLDDINAALDRFPLDRAKLPTKPANFSPNCDWLFRDYHTRKATGDRVDMILEGKYGKAKKRKDPTLSEQIEALEIAVDAQQTENNRLWLSSVLKSKRDQVGSL
jgi:hypothetical protein